MPQAILTSTPYMGWSILVISLCNQYLLYTFCIHGWFLYFNELLVIKIIIIIMPSTIVVWGVTGGLVGHFWLASQFGEQIMKLKDSAATCGLYWLSLFLWVLCVPAYPWFNLTGPDSWEARLVPIGQWLIPQPHPPPLPQPFPGGPSIKRKGKRSLLPMTKNSWANNCTNFILLHATSGKIEFCPITRMLFDDPLSIYLL